MMKKGIMACFAMLMLLAGTTIQPAQAQRFHGYYGRGYGGYRYHHEGLGLGLGLAGLGIGLGLNALESPRYYYGDDYYYNPPVRVYTAPAYGYGGSYWY